MPQLLLFIFGLVGLFLGTQLIVRGTLHLAEYFKLSQVFIGLTVLAIGTDLPELIVSITGSFHKLKGVDTSGLIVGDIIGSTFGQIGLTLGIVGLLGTVVIQKKQLYRDGLMMLGSVALLFLVSFDGVISRFDGVIFLIIYLGYFLSLQREEKMFRKNKKTRMKRYLIWVGLSVITGFFMLFYSSELIINNGVYLAELWGVPQSIIGILFIGLGTSLPEIAVSFEAIRRGALGLSVGNLIGSNIFDILVALGLSSAISGLNVSANFLYFDIPALFLISLVVLLVLRTKMKLSKREGSLLIGLFGVYILLKLLGL